MNSTGNTLAYELSRIYPVSRERLFQALTDAAVLKKVWGVQEIVVDARVGGTTRAMFITEGQDWSFSLTYTEIVPDRTLRWTVHFNSFPTKETKVTVSLKDTADGTELLIRMKNFETAEERDANKQAWQRGLALLADSLS